MIKNHKRITKNGMILNDYSWGWKIGDREREMVKMVDDVISDVLIDVNAKIFERAIHDGYAIESFIDKFMRSQTAETFDVPICKYYYDGDDRLMDDFLEECAEKNIVIEKTEGVDAEAPYYIGEIAYWCGYVYRTWHFRDGIRSVEMIDFLPIEELIKHYPWGHTMIVDDWLDYHIPTDDNRAKNGSAIETKYKHDE